jgi:hypothetical protein
MAKSRVERGLTKKARRRSYRKKSGVFATPVGTSIASFGGTRESVLEAAGVLSRQAKANAASFSRRIPMATYVAGFSENQAMVVTDGAAAPNAAPFEFGERHPVFGNRNVWRKQPLRPYMNRAATGPALDEAADVYADLEAILLGHEHGYTE